MLDHDITQSWARHAPFFNEVVSYFRNDIAQASITVTKLPDIHNNKLDILFNIEGKAQVYFWYIYTLIFFLFAKFSFLMTAQHDRKEVILKFC